VAKENGGEFATSRTCHTKLPEQKLLLRQDYKDAWRKIKIMQQLPNNPR
jgi:hypothetical protein